MLHLFCIHFVCHTKRSISVCLLLLCSVPLCVAFYTIHARLKSSCLWPPPSLTIDACQLKRPFGCRLPSLTLCRLPLSRPEMALSLLIEVAYEQDEEFRQHLPQVWAYCPRGKKQRKQN